MLFASAPSVSGPASSWELVRVASAEAHEGPVYVESEHALYYTTVRRGTHVAIERLDLAVGDVSVVRPDANVANGMALDAYGRLIVCEQGTFEAPARISRFDLGSGTVETVVDSWQGLPLNSPNDVVVARDGSIWFTDPSYGHLQGFRPPPRAGDHVYRFHPDTGVELVADGFDKPNGLAFSPDERTLYVSDNGAPHHLLAFDVEGTGLGERRVLALGSPEHPDGVKVDASGAVFASDASGVRVLDPAGGLLSAIALPGAVNFAFGGPGRNVLYITADTAVWAAVLTSKGA